MKFIAGLAALATMAAAAPREPTPLDIKLESSGNSQIKATITNTGKSDLKVLRAGSIFDKSANEKAKVFSGEKQVKFQGIRQRVATKGLKDSAFHSIPAGKSVTVNFDVAQSHDLSDGGVFDIHSAGALQFAKDGSNKLVGSVPFHSDKIQMKVNGAEAAKSLKAFRTAKRTQVQDDCQGDALSVTEAALKSCVDLSNAAADDATNGDGARLQDIFHDTSDETRQHVADVFGKVAAECGSTDGGASKYYCTDVDNGCEEGVLAYTLPSESFMAYCQLYFDDLPALTDECHAQDQATTNLHEVTHLSEIAGTDDLGYGYDNIVNLSTEDSLNNADSYAVFANAVYVGC